MPGITQFLARKLLTLLPFGEFVSKSGEQQTAFVEDLRRRRYKPETALKLKEPKEPKLLKPAKLPKPPKELKPKKEKKANPDAIKKPRGRPRKTKEAATENAMDGTVKENVGSAEGRTLGSESHTR